MSHAEERRNCTKQKKTEMRLIGNVGFEAFRCHVCWMIGLKRQMEDKVAVALKQGQQISEVDCDAISSSISAVPSDRTGFCWNSTGNGELRKIMDWINAIRKQDVLRMRVMIADDESKKKHNKQKQSAKYHQHKKKNRSKICTQRVKPQTSRCVEACFFWNLRKKKEFRKRRRKKSQNKPFKTAHENNPTHTLFCSFSHTQTKHQRNTRQT